MSGRAQRKSAILNRHSATLFSGLWSPDGPLPDGAVLREMAARVGQLWGVGNLHERARIGYNPRMRSALGRAFYKDSRIELNTRLLTANPSELVCTLVHELAHLVAYWRFGHVQPHGVHFRSLMQQAGFPGRATHRLAVNPLRRRRKFLYLHVCSDCGMKFTARSVRRNCYCRACGPKMKWDIYRVGGQTPVVDP